MARAIFPDPSGFRQAARAHQRDWVTSHLHAHPTHPERVTLPVAEAIAGKNFYSGDAVREAVLERFPATFTLGASGHPTARAADALSSAHIPFNLFAPLRAYLVTPGLARFMATLTARDLASVSAVGFEYADPDARKSIDDNTSFDAYVLAQAPGPAQGQGSTVFIGVEVKYTEGPYGWGKREKRRMFASEDSYHRLTRSSGLFETGAITELRTRHLKQMWRNMLLGAATGEAKKAEFIYIHLYPSGNTYQATACSRFAEQLTPRSQAMFRPTTYDEFLTAAAGTLPADALPWLEYIRARYVVPAYRFGA